MQKALSTAGRWAGRFCGVFLVYVVAGGLLGFALAVPGKLPEPVCWPYHTTFDAINANCEDFAPNLFWLATVGLPRFIIVFPSLAISMFKAFATNFQSDGEIHYLGDALAWTAMSIPMAAMSYAGFRYWRVRSPVVAWVLIAALVGQMLVLGLD